MTWTKRFQLLFGTLLVLVLVAAATLVFNQRQTRVESVTAAIEADTYGVGTDYSGLVVLAHVDQGDHVVEGQRMFELQSLQLERDLELGIVTANEATVSSDGTFVVRASATGTVGDLDQGEGAYAQSGEVLATIDADGSLFAEAEFRLSPRDFGRLEDTASVELELPDGRSLTGSVSSIDVETLDGEAHVTVRVDSEDLATGDGEALLKPGTPLEATLHLRDDGPLAGVGDMVDDFVDRIGL